MRNNFKPSLLISRLTWQGFPLQLFLFTIFPLSTLLLVIAFGSLSLHHQAMRSLVGDRDLRAVRAAANSLDQEITHQVTLLQFIKENANDENDLIKVISKSKESLSGFDKGVLLISPKGEIVFSNVLDQDWLKNTTDLDKTISDLLERSAQGPTFSQIISQDKGGPIILTSVPLPNRYLLIGAFTSSTLIKNGLDGSVSSGQTTVLVVGPGYRIIYQVGSLVPEERLASHPGITEALKGESGINYYQTPEGEHVVAFSPIAAGGWALMIEESWETISSPLLRATQYAPLIIVPVFILALIALWFGARRIVQPLQALEKRTSEFANGDIDAIQKPVGGIPEIRHLQTELISMAMKLNSAQESLHNYIGAITDGIENERRSLARELHDDTIQALIALNQRLQLSAFGPNNPSGKANTNELQQLVQQAVVNLRRIIRGLRPIYLEDLGLGAALGMLAKEINQAANLPVDFRTKGNEVRLEPATELALYRIAQEALSNVVRHAQAKNVWVEIDFQPSYFHMTIKDDGKGFTTPNHSSKMAQTGHFGLLGLQERAELINSKLEIFSSPGNGTIVSVHLNNNKKDKP